MAQGKVIYKAAVVCSYKESLCVRLSARAQAVLGSKQQYMARLITVKDATQFAGLLAGEGSCFEVSSVCND